MSPATLRKLHYAEGYLTLGMKAEAAEALAEIAETEQDATPVLHLRAALLLERSEWAGAAELLTRLCEREPTLARHWIQRAYATRRHTGIDEAREILLHGLRIHPREPTIHFNLACYEAQLGRLDTAKTYLEAACRLDEDFVAMARTDPDLEPLRRAGGIKGVKE